jgi:RNA-directed DNA polymerase
MKTELTRITEMVKRDKEVKVNNVMYLLGEVKNLVECFQELKRDRAPGVDGVTTKEYEGNLVPNLEALTARMKKWQYRPQPVRRTYIEKANGKRRPLGIPAVEDKVLQQGMRKILEAVYEPEFLECSYGFRVGRNCHQALDAVDKMVMREPVNYIIDADIKGFFDTVDQQWLIKFVGHRISDKSLLRLLVRMLKSGVMEEGKVRETDRGTPQGGIMSPLLANIYLHFVLDLWMNRAVIKGTRGYVGIVRYADDFVIGVEHAGDAEKILNALRERFKKFGLALSEDKTKIIQFGRNAKELETFNFLGFTHFNDKTRHGGYKVGRKTDHIRFARALKSLNGWLMDIRNLIPTREWWRTLAAKLRGHFQYYGVSGNMHWLKRFNYCALIITKKWLNRRSQKKSMNWEDMLRYVKRHPLPTPHIHHNFYTGLCYDYAK